MVIEWDVANLCFYFILHSLVRYHTRKVSHLQRDFSNWQHELRDCCCDATCNVENSYFDFFKVEDSWNKKVKTITWWNLEIVGVINIVLQLIWEQCIYSICIYIITPTDDEFSKKRFSHMVTLWAKSASQGIPSNSLGRKLLIAFLFFSMPLVHLLVEV